MSDQFGRAGRRADLARLLQASLMERGCSVGRGGAAMIDEKVAQVASRLGMSEAAALKHFRDREVVELAVNTADAWHASQVAEEVAGDCHQRRQRPPAEGCGARPSGSGA